MKLIHKAHTAGSILLDRLYYRFALPKVRVISTDKTLDMILNRHISIVRFGDGEFDLIAGKSILFQQVSPKLSKQLSNILFGGNDKFLVCVPDFFTNISRYTKASKQFWKHDIRERKELYKRLAATNHTFGSAQVSRPYLNIEDKNMSKRYFKKLKQIWVNKDILIVEGETSRSGVGNDLFNGARSVKRIICPSSNAYSKVQKIKNTILRFKDNRLILLMLGPTAKIIVSDLAGIKNQMIEIGHIDSEYEWFLRGDLVRTKIPNKHTAEFNLDTDVVLADDPEYASEIMAKVL